MSQDEFNKLFFEIQSEWNKAEKDIKLAEQIRDQVVFPAIKELRYCGRRLVDALAAYASGKLDEARAYLADAKFDCYRARHDAIDAGLSTISSELRVYAQKLGYACIIQGFPDYPKLIAALNAGQAKIVESRGQRENRDQFYQSIEETEFVKIVDLFRAFKANEEVIRGLGRSIRWWKVWGIIATIIMVLLAALAVPWKDYIGADSLPPTVNNSPSPD